MRKVFLTEVIALGLGLMSFTSNSTEVKEEFIPKIRKVTVVCENGYESFYYDMGYSASENAEIQSSICKDA